MDNRHQIQVNNISDDAKKSFKNRVIIGIILVLIVLPCIIIGDYAFMCLIFLATVISTHEICKAPQSIEKKFKNVIYVFAYLMMIILVYWTFSRRLLDAYLNFQYVTLVHDPKAIFSYDLYTDFNSPSISLSAFAFSMLFLFLMVFIDKNFTIHDAFYFIGMLFIVSLGYQSVMYLRLYPFTAINNQIEYLKTLMTAGTITTQQSIELEYLKNKISDPWFKYGESACLFIYTCLGTLMCDTGAYIIGMLFGKHQLSPKISPKKTVEGFIGGIVFSIAITITFSFSLVFTGHDLVYGLLDKDHWYLIVIISLLMPLLSTFGDLLFSSVKRGYQIKDFGKILQSHGGVLDRVDSVLITSILLGLIIPFFNELLKYISTFSK